MSFAITARLLRSKGACREQVEIFAAKWPDGVEITSENCLSSAILGLDLDWAARNFLSATAEKAYQEATAPAWKAYQEARATAFYAAWLIDYPELVEV